MLARPFPGADLGESGRYETHGEDLYKLETWKSDLS